MAREMKMVIILREDKGSIGISSPDCDPLFSTFEGSLEQALERLPELVAEAQQQWDSNPRYPRCETPLPSQKEAAAAPSRVSSPKREAAKTQPSMF